VFDCDDNDETPDETPKQNTNTNENISVGGFVILYSWLVALLALETLVFVLGLSFVDDDRETAAGLYLLALTWSYGRPQYTDDPETMNGENGEAHEVI
jgi:hypothetical protein